ncbi:receptor-transporting protein 1-like [Bombina bombina]|uniref:receptor-transporting protein 1-like n=1 Tax=Bombina bombina TaxID=8345 RepID=UPI00235AF4EB|nr:receptor-transporting protein 1-like [Bombina bombina]
MDHLDEWSNTFSQKIEQIKPSDRWILEIDNNICDSRSGWEYFVQDEAFGWFHCSQCYNSWESVNVCVVFHMKLDHNSGYMKQGTVKMRQLRQRCHKCNGDNFVKPEFPSNVRNNILDNLIIQIRKYCYKERNVPNLRDVRCGNVTHGRHISSHCEACKWGICKKQRVTMTSILQYQCKIREHTNQEHNICKCCCFCFLIILLILTVLFVVANSEL